MPDFEDAGTFGGFFNGQFGRFAFLEAAAGEDDFFGGKSDDVFGGFEAEAGVGAGDDDGLVGEGRGGLGDFEDELAVEEVDDEAHGESRHEEKVSKQGVLKGSILNERFGQLS